jgi:hypothetical protein
VQQPGMKLRNLGKVSCIHAVQQPGMKLTSNTYNRHISNGCVTSHGRIHASH